MAAESETADLSETGRAYFPLLAICYLVFDLVLGATIT